MLALAAATLMAQDWDRLLKETSFTLEESVRRGLQEAGDGVPFHAELEEDKGQVVYSIDVAQGAKTCNVVMSAKSGKVLEKDVEAEDHSAEVRACRITLLTAIQAALATVAGRAVEAHLVLQAGKPVVRVTIYGGGKAATVAVDGVTGAAGLAEPERFTDRFEDSDWATTGANRYMILEPGYQLVLEGKDEGEEVRLTITVLDETKKVDGVETRVVEEREEKGGKLVEISRNYFAISRKTNNIYYFGEDVDFYRDGKVVGHDGSWLSGEKGARFGLMMPATPLLGARYYQEVAPGVAMDRAEILGVTDAIDTPAGRFENCLRVEETTPLEKGARECKIHAPGVGLVRNGNLRLVRHGRKK